MICFNQIHENDKSGDRQNAFWRAESNHQLFVRSQIAAPAARPAPSSEFRRMTMTMTMTKKKPQTEGDSDK